MLKNVFSDWRTSVVAILGGVLMLAGILWPEKLDLTTQEVVNSAVGEIISGVGALIAVINGLKAKDK